VGFQTRMTWGAQTEVFRALPGMSEAKFLRLGVIHRNTYVDAPQVLDDRLALRAFPHVHLAGQITGCEGYIESLSVGHMVARLLARSSHGLDWQAPPLQTALGALWGHLRGAMRASGSAHEPNNVHWGLFPPLKERLPKRRRKERRLEIARQRFAEWQVSGEMNWPGEERQARAESVLEGSKENS